MAELAREHPPLRARPPGRSRSTCRASATARCRRGGSRSRAYGRLLHDFCERSGSATASLVGNSMGGFVAAEAASADPGRFEKLVLVSAAGVSSARLRRRAGGDGGADGDGRCAAAACSSRSEACRGRGSAGRPSTGCSSTPSCCAASCCSSSSQRRRQSPASCRRVQGLVGYDILDQLTEVDVPTLIVWGRNDHVVPPQDAVGFGRAPAQLADRDLRATPATCPSSSGRSGSIACSRRSWPSRPASS